MEFIEQIEKLYKFFEENLTIANLDKVIEIKQNYNNDLNLIGSFIKDYLCAKNNYTIFENEKIFESYVKYFKNQSELFEQNKIIEDLYNFSNYYLVLIFEDTSCFKELSNHVEMCVATINSLFIMEIYPYLINKFDSFFNLKISSNNFISMLKSIIDVVFKKYENSQFNMQDLRILDYEVNKQTMTNKSERLVG